MNGLDTRLEGTRRTTVLRSSATRAACRQWFTSVTSSDVFVNPGHSVHVALSLLPVHIPPVCLPATCTHPARLPPCYLYTSRPSASLLPVHPPPVCLAVTCTPPVLYPPACLPATCTPPVRLPPIIYRPNPSLHSHYCSLSIAPTLHFTLTTVHCLSPQLLSSRVPNYSRAAACISLIHSCKEIFVTKLAQENNSHSTCNGRTSYKHSCKEYLSEHMQQRRLPN